MSDTLYDYVEETGLIVSDTATVLAEVQSEFTDAFGAGMNLDSTTPQGVLISAETTARSNLIQNNAVVANQINPNQAMGVFLDAICALTGLERPADTYTTVVGAILTGVPGTTVPASSQAATAAGDLFALDADVELVLIAGTGTGTGNFTAVQPGPVPCGAGGAGLVDISTDVLGWETVSNPVAGTVGTTALGDEPLRLLRRNTLYLQGVSLIGATVSALYNLPGVISVQALENDTSETVVTQGITLVAHSIWVCVDGGQPAAIATALLLNKSMGCAWNGAQSLSIVEPASGQTYTPLWDVPTDVPIYCAITVRQGTYVGDPTNDVIAAIVAFGSNSIEGIQGFATGINASPFDISAAVLNQCPGLLVKICAISLLSTINPQPVEIEIAINQTATISASNINVTIVT
jgi:hypothetical protein